MKNLILSITFIFTLGNAFGQSITISPTNTDNTLVEKQGTAQFTVRGKSGGSSNNSVLNLESNYAAPVGNGGSSSTINFNTSSSNEFCIQHIVGTQIVSGNYSSLLINAGGNNIASFQPSKMVFASSSSLGFGISSFFPITMSNSFGDKISIGGNETAPISGGAVDGTHFGLGMQTSLFQIHTKYSTDDIVFGYGKSSAFTENVRIKGNGNVGIGTDTPLASLEVARGTGQNGTAAFQGTSNTSHFNYSTSENTYIRGGKATANVIIADLSANVAIGSGVPLEKLHIFGNIKASGDANIGGELNRTQTSTANVMPIAYGNVSAAGVLQTASSTDNVTVAKAGIGTYQITISSETFNVLNYTTSVTLLEFNFFGFISVGSGSGNLTVYTANSAGTATDKAFTFVVYKK